MSTFDDILKQYWGYDSFRPLQREIIESIYQKKDTLGLMPTGGGKSISFQVPAMAMEGMCIVVTPLIALMKDQVDNLRHRGIKALTIYSGMTRQEILTALENSIYGDFKFLYVSPERLHTELFLNKLRFMNISMLVVDESHCISQWGYDFRPSYLKIADIREHIPNVPVLALTATATRGVVDDIQERLNFPQKNLYSMSFHRENLAYIVCKTEDKSKALLSYLNRIEGTAIIYVRSRKRTKEISDFLKNQGFSSDYYHAGLNNAVKIQKQNAWKKGELRIIVSTNAFGMGIDKSDVRLVVHIDLPNSLEEYFQEAGRAGRDEENSYAIILYTPTDGTKLKRRVTNEFPQRDYITKVYEHLAYFYQVAEGFGMGLIRDFNLVKFCSSYKLAILPTHNALKILDLAGYIEYTDEVDNQSRLIFKLDRNDLYQYGFIKDVDELVNVILRLYTGVFTSYAYINETAIAIRIGKTKQEVYDMLVSLNKQDVIDYIPRKKTPLISYKQVRVDLKYLRIPPLIYEERKERFEARINAMTGYVEEDNTCRNRILLLYFGEDGAEDCNQCDVCIAASKLGLTNTSYNAIVDAIKLKLEKGAMKLNDLIESLEEDNNKKDLDTVIRALCDKQILALNLDEIYIRDNH